MGATSKWLEPESVISGYEQQTGTKASAYLAELAEDIVRLINQAYEDGYNAGLKSAEK
jgi:hypothetical protein